MADVNYRPPGGGATGPMGPAGPQGPAGADGADGATGATGAGFRDGQIIFNSSLTISTTVASISGTAYFCYIGYFADTTTINYVRLLVAANGSGAQTCEVGLFSTTTAPDDTTKTFTKIVSTGTVNSIISGLVPRIVTNTSAFGQTISAGTHVWAGFRTANATTQPTVGALAINDLLHRGLAVQRLSASGALTAAGPWAAGITNGTSPILNIAT